MTTEEPRCACWTQWETLMRARLDALGAEITSSVLDRTTTLCPDAMDHATSMLCYGLLTLAALRRVSDLPSDATLLTDERYLVEIRRLTDALPARIESRIAHLRLALAPASGRPS